MLEFKIYIKPLSVNKLFKGKKYRTKVYDNYEKECILLMPAKKLKLGDMIRVEFVFGFSNKLADADNCVKACLDIMQKKYGFNDRDIYEINIKKKIVPKGKEYIQVLIDNCLPFEFTENE